MIIVIIATKISMIIMVRKSCPEVFLIMAILRKYGKFQGNSCIGVVLDQRISILYPQKTLKNQRFSGDFRVCGIFEKWVKVAGCMRVTILKKDFTMDLFLGILRITMLENTYRKQSFAEGFQKRFS